MKIKTIKISGCKYKVEYSISKNKFEDELSSAFENLEKNNKTEGLNQEEYVEKNGMNDSGFPAQTMLLSQQRLKLLRL